MDDLINEDELFIFFALIGQGIWYLQNVENALHTFITIKHEIKQPGTTNKAEGDRILAKHRRATLGTSLKISKEHKVLSVDLQERMEKFKDERDWLVHRSFHQNGNDLYSDVGRLQLTNRIESFSNEARVLQRLVAQELEDFVVSKGVSRERIYRIADQEIKRLKGELK